MRPTTESVEDVGARAAATWGRRVTAFGCPSCRCSFLVDASRPPTWCRWCGASDLEVREDLVRAEGPERVLPFGPSEALARAALEETCRQAWLPPPDLTPSRLAARLRRVFLPTWLVDGRIRGTWSAEAGFDYEIVSHEERWKEGRWRSNEVTETRVDWEPRAGTLDTLVENVTVTAWTELGCTEEALGRFDDEASEPADATVLDEAALILPDVEPERAWPDARRELVARAADTVTRACGAQHLQQLALEGEHEGVNWTLSLQPAWTTWYRDDEGEVVPIRLHGRSLRVAGELRPSKRRVQRRARAFGAFAAAALGAMVAGTLVGDAVGLGLCLTGVALGLLTAGRWLAGSRAPSVLARR